MRDSFLFRLFKKSETRFHELNYLFWECTTRCNLHCRHCGSDCKAVSRVEDMPLEDFLKALDTIPSKDRANPFTIVLTGGEPLLREDLARCGREFLKRGFCWGLVSNGYLYDEAKQKELLSAGLGTLTISLDGLEENHNWLRDSSKSFERAANAIRLAASEPRINFDVVTCVNRMNINELPALYDFLSGLGLKSWRLFTIIPIGRAATNPDLQLDNVGFRRLMDFILWKRADKKLRPDLMNVQFSCEGYVGRYESLVRDTPFFCRAGINIASVLIDGGISACPNIDRSFIQGNIHKDSLFDVWNNRFIPFRDRSWTKKGSCSRCSRYKDCLGNGFHNWHGTKEAPLVCHYSRTLLEP